MANEHSDKGVMKVITLGQDTFLITKVSRDELPSSIGRLRIEPAEDLKGPSAALCGCDGLCCDSLSL